MTYRVELTHCGNRKVVEFRTTQNQDGSWYAIGHPFGCSRDYPTEAAAIDSLIEAECCTNIEWL